MVTGRVPAYHPPIFNDPFFTVAVMLGWLVMVAGAGILLLTAIILPAVAVLFILMNHLVDYYSFASWTISLPFP